VGVNAPYFPKTVNTYVSMTYRLAQRCNASYKDFIFAPIDQVNPLRALFRHMKPTWCNKSAYVGLKNSRITVFSIGYGVHFRRDPPSYRPSVNNSPLEALLVLDRGKVSPPMADRERGSGAVPVQTPCERQGNIPVSPFTVSPGLLIPYQTPGVNAPPP